jgi:hypothetical protein
LKEVAIDFFDRPGGKVRATKNLCRFATFCTSFVARMKIYYMSGKIQAYNNVLELIGETPLSNYPKQ